MPYKIGGGKKLQEYDPSTGRYGYGVSERDLYLQSITSKCEHNSALMPNYKESITDDEKFTNYSLNPDNPNNNGKAEAYKRGLGFTKDNYKPLKNQIHNAVVRGTASLIGIKKNEFGVKFIYEIPVHGVNGKTKTVVAVYIVTRDDKFPRMVTNYLKGKIKIWGK